MPRDCRALISFSHPPTKDSPAVLGDGAALVAPTSVGQPQRGPTHMVPHLAAYGFAPLSGS